MSLLYVIDGYNITNHPIFIQHINRKVKDKRLALLGLIRARRLAGSSKNNVILVFDGHISQAEAGVFDVFGADIEVIFSRKESADTKIKKLIQDSVNPRTIIVVSDDKEIRFFVRSLGGRMLSVEEFITRKVNSRKNRAEEFKPELTHTKMHRINQELRKLWLK